MDEYSNNKAQKINAIQIQEQIIIFFSKGLFLRIVIQVKIINPLRTGIENFFQKSQFFFKM